MKNNKYTKIIPLLIGVIILSLIIGYVVWAWTEPTAAPPGANRPAPINVSTTTQNKEGIIGAHRFQDFPDTQWFVDPASSLSAAFSGNVGIGTTAPGARLQVQGVGTTTAATVNITDSTGASRFFVRDDGNVGIGTTTPGARLHVVGNIIAAAPTALEHVATRGWVEAQPRGPRWAGYTPTTFNGNLGGTRGANAHCHAAFPGSRACLWDDKKRLGSAFPWSTFAWVVDAMEMRSTEIAELADGTHHFELPLGWRWTNCRGWLDDRTEFYGAMTSIAGHLSTSQCSNMWPLPCCFN